MHPLKLVDSHIHLVDTNKLSYQWQTAGFPVQQTLPGDYTAATGHFSVEQIVFIEAGVREDQSYAEAIWVSELATEDPRIAAIVAQVCPERGRAVEEELDCLRALPLVRGVRRILEPPFQGDPAFCVRPQFIDGIRLLPKYGFSFDISVKNYSLPHVVDMVKQCPDVEFILDHIGKPSIRDSVIEPWRFHLRELAELRNVACKISGMPVEAGPGWTVEQFRPYVREVVEAFGFDRLLYGSDYPAQNSAGSFVDWTAAIIDLMDEASDDERAKFFGGNAQKYYGLAPR